MTGFNRYIVECKAVLVQMYPELKSDLIDTLWNVKSVESETKEETMEDLIDTLWNVKLFSDQL